MKIFLLKLLLALTSTLVSADISLKSDYNNNNELHTYYIPPPQQQQQQQPQTLHQPLPSPYSAQNVIPTQYFSQSQQQNKLQVELQQQQNQRLLGTGMEQQQQFAIHYPMPTDFPLAFRYQQSVLEKASTRSRIPKKPIITKHFFLHSAPEESQAEIEEDLAVLQQQPRKHYNVLFVKSPSQTSKTAALNLAKALREEKTVVYVLAKKTSAADLQDAIQESPKYINKPEVFFIRYRTPEEAAKAQYEIQSQYDSLGGSTIISDEGIAPATSVIGSLNATQEKEEQEQQQPQQKQQQSQGQIQTIANYEAQKNILTNSLSPSAINGYLPPPNKF